MTGTPISNKPRAVRAAAILALGVATACADEVNLDGGRRVTGTIAAIQADGTTTLQSPIAAQPLRLRGDAVRSVTLTPPAARPPGTRPHALILRNDDVIPCEVAAMDDTKVSIHSAALGDLAVPREAIRAIRFGLHSSKVVLDPADAFKNWAASEAWKITPDSATSSAVGNTSLAKLKLPQRFILRCRIEWQGYPNLRLHFADNRLEASGQADRYFLTFNQAGLELKRQCSSGRAYHSLAVIPKTPDTFVGSPSSTPGFDLEIRVDRPARTLQLSINGELQDTYTDPADAAPADNGLMLLSSSTGNNRNIVRNLSVIEWSPGNESPAADIPAAGDADMISVLNAPDTMSGVAQSIRVEDGKPAVVFQSPHSDQPIVVTNTALLTFRKPAAQDQAAGGPLAIELAGNGKLTTRSCTLDPDTISADHPLLGTLKLQRAEIRTISRATQQPAAPDTNP